MDLPPDIQALLDLLFTYANERTEQLTQAGRKLAHYTTAETALAIIQSGRMRMRNATVMNDHSEIEHGRSLMRGSMETALGQRFKSALDRTHPGLGAQVLELLGKQLLGRRENVFMTSLSEHVATDQLGKLSMWRAYGGPIAGVALIFNADAVMDAQFRFNAYSSPVFYSDVEDYEEQFARLIGLLEANRELVSSIPVDIVTRCVLNAFNFAALSLKHPGFREEEEWRIIHQPFTPGEGSAWLREKVVSVRGIPQLIYELPMMNEQGMGLPQLCLNNLIHRVIVGPSLYPDTVRRGLVDALTAQGVENASSRVTISDIPLRQWG